MKKQKKDTTHTFAVSGELEEEKDKNEYHVSIIQIL